VLLLSGIQNPERRDRYRRARCVLIKALVPCARNIIWETNTVTRALQEVLFRKMVSVAEHFYVYSFDQFSCYTHTQANSEKICDCVLPGRSYSDSASYTPEFLPSDLTLSYLPIFYFFFALFLSLSFCHASLLDHFPILRLKERRK
jgi:hypothetical protein